MMRTQCDDIFSYFNNNSIQIFGLLKWSKKISNNENVLYYRDGWLIADDRCSYAVKQQAAIIVCSYLYISEQCVVLCGLWENVRECVSLCVQCNSASRVT